MLSKTEQSCCHMWRDMALSLVGLDNTTRAKPPCTLQLTSPAPITLIAVGAFSENVSDTINPAWLQML
jgi:hypothetical protein